MDHRIVDRLRCPVCAEPLAETTAGTARALRCPRRHSFDIARQGPAVRGVIGAALQEAALDGLLTGREHMRLQTGLQGIPKDYDEVASVFGATYWQRLRYVILPQLRPSLQVAMILRTILALQTFAVAQALAGRNFPLLVGETYYWYNFLQNPNVAAAIALVVLAISMVTAVGYLRLLRDRSPGAAR